MVPGIAPSADPMLQARMFAYPDAARYRLGANYQQLPPNAAHSPVYSPYERDGFATISKNYGGDPNYVRSALRPMAFKGQVGAKGYTQHEKWVGEVAGFTSEITDEDFVQPRGLWEVMGRTEGQQENFVANIAEHLKGALPQVQKETFSKSITAFAHVLLWSLC
jgi:catalase